MRGRGGGGNETGCSSAGEGGPVKDPRSPSRFADKAEPLDTLLCGRLMLNPEPCWEPPRVVAVDGRATLGLSGMRERALLDTDGEDGDGMGTANELER